MSEENAHKLWEERAHRQFEPLFTASGKGIDTDAALRMAPIDSSRDAVRASLALKTAGVKSPY